MKQLCNYQLGEVVTSLRKTQIESIGNDVIAYSTTMGSIGAFYPIESSDDLDFYIRLEMLMRTYFSSISNQDHFKYRSFSGACKVK
jgi:splicing factor 3B subunit 3